MFVIKRDGRKEEFNADKVFISLKKAFVASDYNLLDSKINELVSEIQFWDDISVEEIQDQIEEVLMDYGYNDVAKQFIIYRFQHQESRHRQDRLNYMKKYKDTSENAATLSNTDPNANSSIKNVASLEAEVYKAENRITQRQNMKDKLSQIFPEVAKQYEEDLNNHIIYTNDEASTPVPKFYCQAVSLYPLMLEGVGNIDGVTPSAPNDIESFSGQLTNLIFTLSSQCKGAVACLHGSQKLLINGKSISIKDFVMNNWINPSNYEDWEYCNVSDKDFKILEDGKYVKINKVFRKKYKNKILTITSNNGFTAKVSENHKFKVFEKAQIKEVEAKDLKLFDTVFVNPEIPIDFTSRDYKEGWIKGMLLGDDCLTQPNRVQLSVNYDQEYYADVFNEYCSEIYGETLYQCAGHNCYQYETHKKDFSSKLKEGIFGTNAFDKNINIDNNINYLVGVLDGLLCSDGGDYHSIGIALVNENLINTVKYILDILNIKYSYKIIPAHEHKSTLYHLNISTKVLNFTPNLLLKLGNKHYNYTYYHSGFANTRNRTNPEYILSNKKGHFKYPLYKTDVITAITSEDNDDDYVYEIETETHWYNCGGFITHNCGSYFIALNYYIIAEFGNDWYNKLDELATSSVSKNPRTVRDRIYKGFSQFVWGINQPAGNRSYQSPFTNISYYDHTYFDSLFGDFYYPDGTKPEWQAVNVLQKLFMKWFNKLRTKAIVAFPVETVAMVYDPKTNEIIDKEWADFTAEMYAEGHSFFTYISDSADSLSSCCRLKNKLAKNTFNPTSGLTGVQTGSCNVITLNLNRIIQDCDRNYGIKEHGGWKENTSFIKDYLISILDRVYKYHIAYKTILYDWEDSGMFTCCNAGYIHMSKLYSTVGVNGLKIWA